MTGLRKETKPFKKNTSTVNKEMKVMMYQRNIEKYECKRTTSPIGSAVLIFWNDGCFIGSCYIWNRCQCKKRLKNSR